MKGCKVLSKAEINKVLKAAESQRDRMIILTGLYFGTRIAETVALTFGDFKGKNVRIKHNKGSNEAILTIPAEYKKALKSLAAEYRRTLRIEATDDTPLFLSRRGKIISQRHANRIISDIADKAGIEGKVNAHSFRKCFTTKVFEMTGYNVFQTIKYTGHKTVNNLMYYVETTKENNLTTEFNWV